jgi:hypothetical protein
MAKVSVSATRRGKKSVARRSTGLDYSSARNASCLSRRPRSVALRRHYRDPERNHRPQATGQAARLDPALVSDALERARQFAPVLRSAGMVGPERAVAEDADDLTRLLAIFGRHNPDD